MTNGYLLALAVMLIPVEKVGDRFGHKKVFLTGIVGFAAASATVGLSGDIAKSISLVIAFRVAQGAFGAMLQPRFGPRIPLVAGMLLAAVALFGLSRIGIASSLNDTILWFALLGLGLSPVIVGATDVIVGNASVELAGVAGGLQSTAMQVGGTIGTAVLGAIMAAKIDSRCIVRPISYRAWHLQPRQAGGS